MTFQRPCRTTHISDSFADHINPHRPGGASVNPGVDYTCWYGEPVYAAEAGRVVIADGNPDGAGGRVVAIDFDNGYGCDMLHLSAIAVSAGQRVRKGQRVGWAGGSAFGSNNGRGTHLHYSFRHNHLHLFNVGNLDFEAFYRHQAGAVVVGVITGVLRRIIERNANMASAAKLFYDKTNKVGYERDFDREGPKIKCLGLTTEANYRIQSNNSPGLRLSTSQVATQVEHHGLIAETAETIAWLKLPAGAVKPPLAE
jgi:hypothetical protein